MKKCFKCRRVLPLTEFYRHPMMADGHLGKCRACTRKDVQENYTKKRDHYLDYERSRYNADRIASIAASRDRHPDHLRARRAVHVAVANGSLKRTPCEVCGAQKVEGHHDDYSKPLDVRWLCRKHHAQWHRMDEERRSA
jgi:hypothetical protein